MKVLYIGAYRSIPDGWGQAAIQHILALDAVGVDVVCRPLIYKPDNRPDLSLKILELENKQVNGCTHCVQHILPQHMSYDSRIKNVALFACETSNFNSSIWPRVLSWMDSLWVINPHMKEACRNSGLINKPIHVVPHPIDIKKYNRVIPPLKIEQLHNKFVFYFVGEFVRRKNLATLVKAFNLEFRKNEPVELLIKTNVPFDNVRKFCDDIKQGMKLFKDLKDYPQELILTDRLTEEQLLQLHSACDCLVIPSYGEAYCLPIVDAIGCGNSVIHTAKTGMDILTDDTNNYQVSSRSEPAFGAIDTLMDIQSSRENWRSIDVAELAFKMRDMYKQKINNKTKYLDDRTNAMSRMEKLFSFDQIGNQMKQLLETI